MPARPLLLLPLLLAVAAGCAGVSAEPLRVEPREDATPAPRGEGTYWLVWVHGTQTEEEPAPMRSVAVCGIVFDHELDPDARTLRHVNASAPAPGDVRLAVAFDLWEPEGDCPLEYRVLFNEPDASDAAFGAYGPLELRVREDDGALVAQGREVPLGSRAVLEYVAREGMVKRAGHVVVENLGAWPQAGVQGPGHADRGGRAS